jgi:DNA-binding response OmpR family regulator
MAFRHWMPAAIHYKKTIMTKDKILIVEDEPFLLDMYKMKFKQGGFEVISATDGEEAIKISRREKPDIILLDIMMPKIDGFEVLENLKKNSLTKSIPVLIFSNFSQKEQKEKGIALGAADYFVKTNYTPAQVLEKVESVLIEK